MVRAPATALPAFVPLAVAGNAAIAATILGRGAGLTIAVAVAPAALLALAALVVTTRVALLVPALALSISAEPLNRAYPLAGGLQVVAADVVVALAIGAWAVSRALGAPSDARRGRTASPTLGWPLALFALATLTAVLRGHERYGESLFGQPVRLLLYASVALTISQASARQVYRIIVGVFYVGTVWMMLNAAYHIATGTSQTGAVNLSTGGTRVLSISVSMYMAAALFLALLNLRDDESAARRGLHLTIACLAAVGVILGYGRAIFAGVALVLVLFLFHREIRRSAAAVLPLFLPLIVLAAILGLQAAPNVLPAFIDRVTASPAQDTNVEWRGKANAAVFEQVRESPLIGVGFGRDATFTVHDRSSSGLLISRREHTSQDPHNSFLYLLAGGGIFALGSFLLLCGVSAWDARRRLRASETFEERTIVRWSVLTLFFVFFLNALTEPVFGMASEALTVWTLLVLPSVVPLRRATVPTAAIAAAAPVDRVTRRERHRPHGV